MKYNENLVKQVIDKFKSMNYKPEDITIYLDMDNVLCLFSVFGNEDTAVRRMFHKGYFKELQCFPEVPAVIENLQRIGFKIKVLSSCIDSPYCKPEKKLWLNYHIPTLSDEDIILINVGENKADYIDNPESITKIGTAIKVSGPAVSNISDVFGYISPSPMSGEAKQLQDEFIKVTQQLHGAGSLFVGQIDPQKASGAAIVAVQEQAAIPLGENTASFHRLIEDVANIWLDMWICYHPDGMKLGYEKDESYMNYIVPQHILRKMKFNIRVDISPVNPFSKYAREQSLENALVNNHITFEEFVSVLDDDSTAPKGKFEDVIKKRSKNQNPLSQNESGEVIE